jgi:hypothetical protein
MLDRLPLNEGNNQAMAEENNKRGWIHVPVISTEKLL